MRHPPQGLNLDMHTNQEVHDASWIGAQGLSTNPGLETPGGAALGQWVSYSSNFVDAYERLTREEVPKIMCKGKRYFKRSKYAKADKLGLRKEGPCLVTQVHTNGNVNHWTEIWSNRENEY